MQENYEQTEKLLATTQVINVLSKDFEKSAHNLESIVETQNTLLCSKKCFAVFFLVALFGVEIYGIVKLR